ncbi:2-dehydropantoate 2-reductase N-terminal domain-containing protein [Mesorhizobium sp.]|jgi:2-dehydropantoate 2-reductase|uniref:ketopantoate reductase family protein n=1 Tax=Mesorhizobium sp. TaxID=1871066 RepID=UPI000FE43BB7|nr:2-dehydropantoate 2-reductase N-terminal domain-containing protein [Mesorhizobium sp.]RWH69073.1 MAG: ketopantoate reductase family protein [Mesorhizobium sp.]RWL26224.1 MAG: ketopantoate reductase family protein [Mesorhizobium sp.]RWL26846.1 MAG: ketopantoate reductase family protein [Mesorhizobium sp.]RWL37971.1 MAG: ketopantoate reductase family protein [Mesorhizobium sp.]RWL56923.1 MAG: ketopantoate reductase family protein [Mesorhizobium sp.]
MRIIVYGIGAIGGAIAAQLSFSGHDVVGIARGRQLDAIRASGLSLSTPQGTRTAHFPVHADPAEISFRPDDAVLLTMKTPDTLGALQRLNAIGVSAQPIFCFQNGVANEPLALRFFANVYGATVMLPADYDTPGEVAAYFTPKIGAFDIGRYPSGTDDAVKKLRGILRASGFIVDRRDNVMSSKYRKLLSNLRNIIDAALADTELQRKWYARALAEAEAVLTAAGIAWDKTDAMPREELTITTIPGRTRVGSSTLQSIVRGTGSLETDFLNGEIVLLGRLHGMVTPVNAALCRLSIELASGRMPPQSAGDDTIASMIGGAG